MGHGPPRRHHVRQAEVLYIRPGQPIFLQLHIHPTPALDLHQDFQGRHSHSFIYMQTETCDWTNKISHTDASASLTLTMPISPKRYGFIIDDGNWPLRDSLRDSNPPELSHSPCSSAASVHSFRPATPVTPGTQAPSKSDAKRSQVSSLHFSTTDEKVDAAEFHRIAAQMLSGEIPQNNFVDTIIEDNSKQIRQREFGFPITNSHPCLICDLVCSSDDQLRRHITSRHDNHMEICPECGDLFTADFLPTHLASGLGGCAGMMQASYMSQIPQVDDAYMTDSYFTSASQRYWIYDGDHSWDRGSHLGSCFEDDDDEEAEHAGPVEQTFAHMKNVLRRPVSQTCTEACNLCGDRFSTGSSEFAQHMERHSQDFAQKQHKCDECHIFFANEADLERHLQSADLNQHCGFTFRHNEENCTGHHQPTSFMASTADDHFLMQKHLWAWERCQLQTNRLSLSRVLKAQKEVAVVVAPPSPKVEEAEVYGPFVPHFTVPGREDSFHWSRDDEAEVSEIDAHFSRIISQVFDANADDTEAESQCRPDSMILLPVESDEPESERKSYVDLTALRIAFAQLKNGHKRNAFSGSLPLEFLKQAAQEADRPLSMPTIHVAQAMPLIRLGA